MKHAASFIGDRTLLLLAVASVLLLCLSGGRASGETPGAGGGQGYVLGVQDKINLRVGDWDATTGAYVAWKDFGGVFAVAVDGAVSIPIVGRVPAKGVTPAELTDEIAMRLQESLGLSDPPDVAVEILEFRPVYVLGDVGTPGAFPYAPDLMAIQAVGLAGGIGRDPRRTQQSERNALFALGDYELLTVSLWRALAREARLVAELDNADSIEPSERLAASPIAAALLELETEVKDVNDRALASSLEQIESLKVLLAQQIQKFGEQIKLRARQINLAEGELADVRQLSDRGLTVQTRLNSAERLVADLAAGMLELETAKLRAEQQLNEAERDRLSLVNERRKSLVEQLSESRTRIAELDTRAATAKALFAEAANAGAAAAHRSDAIPDPTFTIMRRDGDDVMRIEADQTTLLQPGDVLEVELPDLDDLTGWSVLEAEGYVLQVPTE